MTSINDIPNEDIEKFLDANNLKIPMNRDDAYDIAFKLFKSRNSVGHTKSIIEWMKAYNLIKNKVNIKNYTLADLNNMNQNQLDNLAKTLTMNGNNLESIKQILRYLHKLDETVHFGTTSVLGVAGKNVYDLMLQNMDVKSLNRMDVNKYSKSYLQDQQFWKKRLNEKLELFTNVKDFDYKFAVKFLDNGKSFEENYKEAMDKGYKSIIKLLLDNKVVLPIKPRNFLDHIIATLADLGNKKNLPYNEFIQSIIDQTNEIMEDDPIDLSYFAKFEFTDKNFKFELSDDNYDTFLLIKLDLITDGGISNGEILYKIAQLIPNDEEIRIKNLKYIKENTKDILDDIENKRKYYKEPGGPNRGFLENLIKSPEKFLDYINNNSKNQINSMLKYEIKDNTKTHYRYLPDYSDYLGNHIYWEGLYLRDDDVYEIMLGS